MFFFNKKKSVFFLRKENSAIILVHNKRDVRYVSGEESYRSIEGTLVDCVSNKELNCFQSLLFFKSYFLCISTCTCITRTLQ